MGRSKKEFLVLLEELMEDSDGEQTIDEILEDVNGEAWRKLFEKGD